MKPRIFGFWPVCSLLVPLLVCVSAAGTGLNPDDRSCDLYESAGIRCLFFLGKPSKKIVVEIDPSFSAAQIAAIKAAFNGRQGTDSTSFSFVSSVNLYSSGTADWYAVINGGAPAGDQADTGGSSSQGSRINAYTNINPGVTNLTALQEAMVHEIGHIFGLNDCLSCAPGSSAMDSERMLGASMVHGVDPPSSADPYVQALFGFEQRAFSSKSNQEVSEWQARSAALLEFTEHLSDNQGCDTCLFYRKFILYYIMFDNSPSGAAKTAAFRSATQFFANSTVKQTDPLLWIAQMKVLINYSRHADDNQLEKLAAVRARGIIPVRVPVSEGQAILDEMVGSHDSIMQAYARYERLFQPPYEMPPY